LPAIAGGAGMPGPKSSDSVSPTLR
jgi:hypothetical protein